MQEIALSAGMRANLSSLKLNSRQLTQVQGRLATGRKVNSAVDNPTNFFAAANLSDRGKALESRLDGMGQAISTLKAADTAITSMRSIIGAMKGVVDEALASPDSSDRVNSGKQFNELLIQLHDLATDASYKGVNLLQSGQIDKTAGNTELMTVQFNENYDEATLAVNGINVQGATGAGTSGVALNSNSEFATGSAINGARTIGTATTVTAQSYAITLNISSTLTTGGTGSANQAVVGLRAADITGTSAAAENATGTGHTLSFVDSDNYQANLKQMVSDIEEFDDELVNTAKLLSQNVNIVSIRQDFAESMINNLQQGADKLTLADLNEEGANLLALQTAQQLATQSLSLASQAQQGVLSLLG
jgi:flagellin-like hook-associated protein FlgL